MVGALAVRASDRFHASRLSPTQHYSHSRSPLSLDVQDVSPYNLSADVETVPEQTIASTAEQQSGGGCPCDGEW